MRVFLIAPPTNLENVNSQLEPLGLGYVGAVCREAGHEVELCDLVSPRHRDVDALFARLDRFRPQLVGFTAMTETFKNGVKLAAAVKARYGCPVVFGGWHVSGDPSAVREASIDYVVVGEGEETLLELIGHLEGRGPALEEIPGLAFKVDGSQVFNGPRKRLRKLERLPRPLRDGLPLRAYKFGFLFRHALRRLYTLSVQASRGCPYRCSFCQTPTVMGTLWTPREPEDVADELEELLDTYGNNTVMFRDEEFTIRPRWVTALCEAIMRRGLHRRMSWGAFGRVDDITPELAKTLRAAGCVMLVIGVEGTDPESIALTRKSYRVEEVERACRILSEHRITTHGGWIIGFPWDTRESLQRAFSWLLTLELDFLDVLFAVPFAGTELRRQVDAEGLLLEEDTDRQSVHNVNILTPGLSTDELFQLRFEFYRRFLLRPRQVKRLLRRATEYPERLAIFAEVLLSASYQRRFFLGRSRGEFQQEHFEPLQVPARYFAPLRVG